MDIENSHFCESETSRIFKRFIQGLSKGKDVLTLGGNYDKTVMEDTRIRCTLHGTDSIQPASFVRGFHRSISQSNISQVSYPITCEGTPLFTGTELVGPLKEKSAVGIFGSERLYVSHRNCGLSDKLPLRVSAELFYCGTVSQNACRSPWNQVDYYSSL